MRRPKDPSTLYGDALVAASGSHVWLAWSAIGEGYCTGPGDECRGQNDPSARLFSVDLDKTWDIQEL